MHRDDFTARTFAPRRRTALGRGLLGQAPSAAGGIPDFNSLINQEPTAASAWANVQAQLQVEGSAGSGVLGVAQQHFYNAWTQLATAVPVFGPNDLGNISQAAMNLALQNNSIAGAGQLLDGLVQGAISGNPVEIVQAFSGSFMSLAGAAIAAGSISFGAGAAIIVGIELISAWASGLFSSAPTVATICGWKLTYQPTIVVNCAWSTGQPVSGGPGAGQLGAAGSTPQSSPFWRRFPEPTNAADAWWFQASKPTGMPMTTPSNPVSPILNPGLATSQWTSGKSSDSWYAATGSVLRPIDAAFPQYHQLECDVAVATPYANLPDSGGTLNGQAVTPDQIMFARFILAYFGAWKANAEFALNGDQPTYGDDSGVLSHVLTFWNNSHQPGATNVITPRNNDVQSYKNNVIVYPAACQGTFANEWWYVSMLINELNVASITVNTGPRIVFPIVGLKPVLPIKLSPTGSIPHAGTPATTTTSSGPGTTAIAVVGGLAIVGIGGLYLYGRAHHMNLGQSAKTIWSDIKKPFRSKRGR
jgi:hypothetical protein